MTNYRKFTVVQIREQLKERGIPATGLTRKQQLIDRLLEADETQGQNEATAPAPEPASELTQTHEIAQQNTQLAIAQDIEASAQTSRLEDQADGNAAVAHTPLVGGTVEPPEAQKSHQPEPTIDDTDTLASTLRQNVELANAQMERVPEMYEIGGDVESKPAAISAAQTAATVERELDVPSPMQPPLTDTAPSSDGEDSRKRKRRSASPSVVGSDVGQKRHKTADVPHSATGQMMAAAIRVDPDIPGNVVISSEDVAESRLAASEHSQITQTDIAGTPESALTPAEKISQANETDVVGVPGPAPISPKEESPESNEHPSTATSTETARQPVKQHTSRDNRYKDLISAPAGTETTPVDGAANVGERAVVPAIHPASAALYIRNFKRPLRPEQLHEHLNLVARLSSDVHKDMLIDCHLDSMRTHCFASFTSMAAAARVRMALHERVWPQEAQREPLWADYIPEDKVKEWIEMETAGGRSMKKWEVIYERLGDGGIDARLHEVTAAGTAVRRSLVPETGTAPANPLPTPEVRRESTQRDSRASPRPASFLALDSLFKFTTAKPKLYYQPVSKALVDRRMDEIDARTSRKNVITPRGSGFADSRRYTFEEGNLLVDNGPEFGLRQEPSRRGRGGYRGGSGGGGGYRGR